MALTNSQALPIGNISFTTFQLNGFYSLGEWRRFLFIPYFLMILLCVMANSILIFLIISKRSLHSPMFVLIGVMAVLDLILPMFVVPNMLLSFLFDWNQISLLGCLMQIFWVQVFGTFQSTLLLWMALDRFFAICRPLSYHKHMQIANFLKFVIVPVIRNLLINIVLVTLAGKLHFCMKNEIDHCFCEHMGLVQLACQDTTVNNIIGLSGPFLIPTADFIFITVSYAIIFTSVRKSGKSSLKAINTCVTHIIVIAFSLLFVLTAFLSYRIRTNASSNVRIFISTMYVLFPSCFNPIIYGVRTKEIRVQFLKYFKHVKLIVNQCCFLSGQFDFTEGQQQQMLQNVSESMGHLVQQQAGQQHQVAQLVGSIQELTKLVQALLELPSSPSHVTLPPSSYLTITQVAHLPSERRGEMGDGEYITEALAQGYIKPSKSLLASRLFFAKNVYQRGGRMEDYQGHYHYQVMPYGLSNTVLHSFIIDVLKDYLGHFVVAFLDNILVYSPDLPSHIQHAPQVLTQIRAYQLRTSDTYLRWAPGPPLPAVDSWIHGSEEVWSTTYQHIQTFLRHYKQQADRHRGDPSLQSRRLSLAFNVGYEGWGSPTKAKIQVFWTTPRLPLFGEVTWHLRLMGAVN
ncbi:uncharacterized protein [Salminus brasiliensis]|uniref:uncharacterized protein n=1 Tax=Salminus brasiliensis TaxID=930266 RepID=UPI003B83A5A8